MRKRGIPDTARALYAVAAELDTDDLISNVARRNYAAVSELLKSAKDATFDDPDAVAFTLRATLAGATRATLSATRHGKNSRHCVENCRRCRAYLFARAVVFEDNGSVIT
ncbi:hypothetical protein P4S72_02845 [Vibrio sp. PP-XX7]